MKKVMTNKRIRTDAKAHEYVYSFTWHGVQEHVALHGILRNIKPTAIKCSAMGKCTTTQYSTIFPVLSNITIH